jgi:cytochrome c oxidase subunit 2
MESDAIRETKRRVEGALLALAFVVIPVMGIMLAARGWMPPLASEHGAGIDRMIEYLMITVGALFIIGHLALGYFVWQFSRQDRVTFRLASHNAERKWSLIPVIVMALVAEAGVMVLGLPVWGKYYAARGPSDAIIVEVTAEQFAWNVRLPGKDGVFGRTDPKLISLDNPVGLDKNDVAARDDVLLMNEFTVPSGRPVRVRIRSKDTLHSFFLPNLRVKQDAVPGMTIEIGFVPTAEGTFEIACAELCGFGHFQMRGLLRVVSSEKYAEWLKAQQTFF